MSNSLLALFAIFTLVFGFTPMHISAIAVPTSDLTSSLSASSSPPGLPASVTSDSPTAGDDPASLDSPSPDSPEISILTLLATNLKIKSVNPGFKIADIAETGEAIELVNLSEFSLPLDQVSLRYRNDKNTPYDIFAFEDGSSMVAETILLRYEKSPEVKAAIAETESSPSAAATTTLGVVADPLAEVADSTYSKTLALTGSLELVYAADTADEQILDTLCWTGKSGCYSKFTSSSPGSLVYNSETETYDFIADYLPIFSHGLYLPPTEDQTDAENVDTTAENGTTNQSTTPQCQDLEFSELLSYYDESQSEQFIELYNPTDEIIPLSGCQIRYKKKLYDLVATNTSTENLSTAEITPSEFYVYRTTDFTLTKNPNSENLLELVDITGDTVAELTYPHGQKKGAAYALVLDIWRITYLPTPGSANFFQEFKTCPLGKVINETTGNCVKVSATTNSVTPCPAGKYRNPATGRCKNLEDDSAKTKTCKEGYELNPETNRCRKIKTNAGADYALVPITGDPEKSSFIAIWALIAVATLGLGYIIFQFRREIIYFFRRLLARLKH